MQNKRKEEEKDIYRERKLSKYHKKLTAAYIQENKEEILKILGIDKQEAKEIPKKKLNEHIQDNREEIIEEMKKKPSAPKKKPSVDPEEVRARQARYRQMLEERRNARQKREEKSGGLFSGIFA